MIILITASLSSKIFNKASLREEFTFDKIKSTLSKSLITLRDCLRYKFHLFNKSQKFPLWARLYQHVFCKKPSLFSSSSRYRNLGPSESACGHYAYPNPVPLLLATSLVIHEKNWKCLDILAQGFPVALTDYLHRPNFLWNPSANPASHATDRFVLLRVLHFCFRFLLVYAAGFPVAPHSYFHFFRTLDFRCICFLQIRNLWWRWWCRCGRFRGRTRWLRMAHILIYCNLCSWHFLVRCGFLPLVQK